ncbi:hypothetical protein ACLKA7_001979 [Drosophila subpalustris]
MNEVLTKGGLPTMFLRIQFNLNCKESRLGAKGAIIFCCEAETTFKAIEDLAREQGLRSMSEDQVIRPKLSVIVCGLPPSINTNWVSGKIRALGFLPLKVTNIVGNISGRPTSKFRVELDHHDNNNSFLKIATLGSFEVTIDKLHKHKPIVQCFKCQGFDHISSDCISPNFVCSKCAGPHDSRNCLATSESDVKCANCGQGHKATWDSCPAFLDILRSKGLSRRANRAKLAIQASGLDRAHKFQGSLAGRLLSITTQDMPPAAQIMPPAAQEMPPAAQHTPPAAQDTPLAAHDLPPAASRLSPASDDLLSMDHVRPSEVSFDSSGPEYEFDDVGDLVKII